MVGGAWDIVGFGDVAVVTLVDAVESENIGSRTCSGSGVLVMPGHCRGVVTEGDNGATCLVLYYSVLFVVVLNCVPKTLGWYWIGYERY